MLLTKINAIHMIGAIGLSCSLIACAIHPLPENVTGVSTARLVHRIRCEARDAVWAAIDQVKSRHSKHENEELNILEQTGVVYAFALSGDETNNYSATAIFTKALAHVVWTDNPNLSDVLDRKNVRSFTVIDNFQTLSKINEEKCMRVRAPGPNYQYPIVGTIGVAEMVHTFVKLAMHDLVQNNSPESITDVDLNELATAPPTMVDTITFTTTIAAGVNPIILLTPVGLSSHLSQASVSVMLNRVDTHQVVIGLGLPGPVNTLHPVPYVVTTNLASSHTKFGLIIDGAPSTPGEKAAFEAVNRQILRFGVPNSLITTGIP
jgi:hypothetical protein